MHIIDSDNYAASGITTMFFPGGEPHVKFEKHIKDDVLFFGKLRTWNDVGLAACVLNTLAGPGRDEFNIRAFIPYFPGARQDKVTGLAPFTVGLTTDLLDVYAPLYILDPHSPELRQCLDFTQFGLTDLVVPVHWDVQGIIAPDDGAVDRARRFRDKFYPGVPLIKCTKRRDSFTGALSGYYCPQLPERGGRYIVVDDICDGGGTFNLLAEAFDKAMPYLYALELVVSHGIFSKGLHAISPIYSRITTTNSWCKLQSGGRLTVLPIEQLFARILGD